jgi:hypothetical protein
MEKRAATGRLLEHARPCSYRGRMKALFALIVAASITYNYQPIWSKDGPKNASFSECSTAGTEFGRFEWSQVGQFHADLVESE